MYKTVFKLFQIPANNELEVRIPIMPTIDQGTITVTITATSQIREDTADFDVEVLVKILFDQIKMCTVYTKW